MLLLLVFLLIWPTTGECVEYYLPEEPRLHHYHRLPWFRFGIHQSNYYCDSTVLVWGGCADFAEFSHGSEVTSAPDVLRILFFVLLYFAVDGLLEEDRE